MSNAESIKKAIPKVKNVKFAVGRNKTNYIEKGLDEALFLVNKNDFGGDLLVDDFGNYYVCCPTYSDI